MGTASLRGSPQCKCNAGGNPTSYYNGNRWTFGWGNGRQLTSISKDPPVVITTQPENAFGASGSTVTFTVAAKGDRLSYQWQLSTDDGKTWANVPGGTAATLQVTVREDSSGTLYRCQVKDFMGHVSTSQAGELTVTGLSLVFEEFEPQYTTINEPDDYYGRPGDTATFIVEVEGKELSYQWLYCPPGASDFEYLPEETSNVLKVPMTEESDGASYRCFITDFTGNMGSTRIATVKLDTRDWEMSYDSSGVRTQRTSADKTYNYTYAGDKLVKMTVGEDVLEFSYDVDGKPLTMSLNGTVYYYITNLQGDVIRVENNDLTIASYAYDAWGNILGMSGTYAELNPLRYRGYVYDQETGFYYLNSRYYDPVVGRFLNADNINSTGQGLLGLNNYAYCGNNPTARRDTKGFVWETVFDVASLAASIVEVAVNPGDPWAWAGVVGDALDLIPFVTGIGEATRAVKTTAKFIDNADDVVGSAKNLLRTADSASALKKSTGSYEILYKSGKNYVGKGGFDRAIKSAVRNTKRHPDDVVTAIRWKAAPDHRTAFIEEYALQSIKKVGNNKTYNKIWSPGKKYYK